MQSPVSYLFSGHRCASTVDMLLYRWRRLKAQMIEKRSKLGESQTLQQFSRDVDEIEAWISEKLQTASDESYKDPTNIQVNNIFSPGKFKWSEGFHSTVVYLVDDIMYPEKSQLCYKRITEHIWHAPPSSEVEVKA